MAAESLIPGTDMSDSLAFLKKAKIETAPEGIEEGIGALGKARQAEAEAIGKAEGEKAKARTAYAEAEKKAVEPIFRQREQAMKGVRLPETFAPTETNSQDLMSLFTLTGIAGMLLGRGGGKQAALGAQQAMTGMMQGYMAGRKDLYDRERQNFETNMKLMDARKREINDAFEVAFKEATTIGLSQAKTNLENKLAAAGADIYLAKLRTGTIEDAYKAFSDLVKIDQETKKITANLEKEKARIDATIEAARLRGAGGRTSAILAQRAENIRESFIQAAQDIINISNLSPNTVLGAFSGMAGKSGEDLTSSLRNTFARKVTPVEQRMVQQLLAGIEGHLAFALGGGYATSASKTRMDQYKEQIAKAGDDPANWATMMARLRQEMNILAENYPSKPGATEEMNEKVQKYNELIDKAVPFTVNDVINAVLSKQPIPGMPPKKGKETPVAAAPAPAPGVPAQEGWKLETIK